MANRRTHRLLGQCFCYICQLIGRSWERLCDEQTWPTMRELKKKPEAGLCFSSARYYIFVFRIILRSVTSCRYVHEITSIQRRPDYIVHRSFCPTFRRYCSLAGVSSYRRILVKCRLLHTPVGFKVRSSTDTRWSLPFPGSYDPGYRLDRVERL